jgi:hypothetical protein
MRPAPPTILGRALAAALLLGSLAACTGGADPRQPPAAATPRAGAAPSASGAKGPAAPQSGAALHYVSNTHGEWAAAAKLGFNLVDLGPDKAVIDALPKKLRALVWLGNLDNTSCTNPGYTWAKFTAAVDRLAGDPKVFGYYLSDETHPTRCPMALEHVRARADYIRAKDPAQKSFIVVIGLTEGCKGSDQGCEFRIMRPAASHVDLIGVDPFPCSVSAGCVIDKIDQRVKVALAAGVPESAIVPVIQAFGQTCTVSGRHYYKLASQAEMVTMLQHWRSLVPEPVFDFVYTWKSEGPACPALDVSDGTHGQPDLHKVISEHNGV